MRQRDAEHTLQGTVPFRPESNSPSFRHLVHVCSYSALIRPPSQGGKGGCHHAYLILFPGEKQ